MKSKKVGKTDARSSEEHRNAFSFLKNRFFSTTQQSMIDSNSNQEMSEKGLTRSFDEVRSNKGSQTPRPVSMMGMDSLQSTKDALSRRSSAEDMDVAKRSSLIVLKEGYLFKKTDFKPFHKQNKLDRGWKLYRVILRGHKLYLYKVTPESPLRGLFPSNHHQQLPPQYKQLSSNNNSLQSLSFSLSNSSIASTNTTPTTLNLLKSDFDMDAQTVFFNSCSAQGMIFTSVLPSQEQYYLITCDSKMYLCTKKDAVWTIDQSTPISDLQIQSSSSNNGSLLFTIFSITFTTGNCDLGKTWINHLCDDTQIIYRDDDIQGGTIHALIHELLYNDNGTTFVHVFLLTYNLFTTGPRVLAELKSIVTKELESRLLEVFTIWCQQFSLDVMGDVATGMVDILDMMQDAKGVKELVLKTVNDNAKMTCEQKVSSDEEDVEVENTGIDNLLITGLTPSIFLEIDPITFAQQIYLFHFKKHKQFHNELLNPISYLPRPQISVQMLNSLLFSTVAPHFLTKIIRSQILIDSQQDTKDPLLIRSKLLEHWIQVGHTLAELGDMTGWCAVAMGVCSVGVIRLRETWKSVRRDLVYHVKTDWVPILTDYGLFTQDMWADEWIHQTPHVLLSSNNGLPFFGTIRQFTERYRKHVHQYLAPDMINFEGYRCLYNAITSSLKETEYDAVSFTAVGPLQSFFERSVTEMMSLPHDYKYLQECSLACEPRIFGHRYEKYTAPSDVSSLSYLVFPAVLDGCSLFDLSGKKPVSAVQKRERRRRTYSFPPGDAKFDMVESNGYTWLGHHTFSKKSLVEMQKKTGEDIVLTVQQGELVFKVSDMSVTDKDVNVLEVCIKAGTLEQLVDTLVYGISYHEDMIKEQWKLLTLSQEPGRVTMDRDEYIRVFLSTYRTSCSAAYLLDMLRKRYVKRESSIQNCFSPDTSVQLAVLDLILYWIDAYPYDFMDEVEIMRYMSNFLHKATEEADDVQVLECIRAVRQQFIRNSICPCYDMKAIHFDSENSRTVEDLYRQLTNEKKQFHVTLQIATNKSVPLSMLDRPRDMDHKSPVDAFSPESLLEQVDQSVRQLFCAVTTQDWIQMFDVFEVQLQDICAWLPTRNPSRTSRISSVLSPVIDVDMDEILISDIFFAIQNARRSAVAPSAFSDDDLILAFPGSIQYLYCMHFIIRSWVIHEIAGMDIDANTRMMRVEKFLQMMLLCKSSSEKFPEQVQKGRVPGFVEYAIASALVSPEVRLFTKVWHEVAGNANVDYLETLLSRLQPTKPTKTSQCQYLVPSLGWLFERIVELGIQVSDTHGNKDNLVHMDKKKYVYSLLQLMTKTQVDLDERSAKTKSITMSFLISPNPHCCTTWKELKEFSHRENKSSGNLVLRGAGSKSHRQPVFSKLVAAQTEKLKRDFKQKERMDKDWTSMQQKIQKKQIEQAKLVDKKGQISKSAVHQHSVMPRINSFFRGLRPASMVNIPIPHLFPYDHQLSIAKASTVINLIHSTTAVASTYTKRDFVFRVVTEEGAQYLFQGMSREEMLDWIKQISNAAREGAAKRQSVLVNETMDTSQLVMERKRTNQRLSVYGVSLNELMVDGKVPTIVEKCIDEIEKRGLVEVGIYRVAGTGSTVSALKAAFNKNVNKVNLSHPEWADINVVADALKQFLRELPEPLLTYTYYDEFITASASEDHDQRVYLLKKTLKKLPATNYTLLKRIIQHFVIVTDFEAINHMYATNLAIVFGPTLLQPAPGPMSFATTMSNLGHHQNIVKYLILNYHYLFDIESEEVEPLRKEDEEESAEK